MSKLAAVGHPESEALNPRERAAIRFAQAMTIDAGDIPDEIAAEFAIHFTPQERVEIVIVASAMGMLNKINDSLRVPPECRFASRRKYRAARGVSSRNGLNRKSTATRSG